MKILKNLLIGIIALLIIGSVTLFFYLQSLKPNYDGELELGGISEQVEVLFDNYGVPHIYAQTEIDAYYALGYAHAQERLFQMELISRLASGRLAEVLGPDLLTTDKFFRTINIEGKAEEFAAALAESSEPHAKATRAYFKGINAFVETGFTPIEFTITGIPMRQYSAKDAYLTIGFLAFGFAEGFRIDPMVAKIEETLGANYLKDLELFYTEGTEKIPVYLEEEFNSPIITALHEAINNIPVPLWNGSNGWALGPSKTKSGNAILENDTHMGCAQPAVWYEAHLEYPGKSFYGNHAALVPFGILGHNRFGAWGLTMFENDDADFFREELNDNNQYKNDSVWVDLISRIEIIKVKDEDDVVLEVLQTRRGPLINSVIDNIDQSTEDPTSVWWAFTEAENDLLELLYDIDHHSSLEEMEAAVARIETPGLNVMYINKNNDIGWWAAGKLPLRPQSMNSKTLTDGSTGIAYDNFIPFENNPQAVNPSSGFVYSANNQPDTIMGILVPGYYVPEDRAKRIVELLSNNDQWTMDQVKEMTADHTSPNHPIIGREIVKIISGENAVIEILADWDGNHRAESIEPTIYYAVLAQIIHDAIADELGESGFNEFGTSHLMKRTYVSLIHNDSSVWWDDVATDARETRSDIFNSAFATAIQTLQKQYGKDASKWYWSEAHTLTHPHALAAVKPLDRIFNVGPFGVPAGTEVINNLMFSLRTNGHNQVTGGPSMRTVIDSQDLEHGYTILPTGQSGNIMSPHYDDQAKMFAENEFRMMMMNREDIEESGSTILVLSPAKE